MKDIYTITIDGPAGSGKSTIATRVAQRLGIVHLNSGAFYRAVACVLHDRHIAVDDVDAIARAVAPLDIRAEFVDGIQHVYVDGVDMTDRLYVNAISDLSSRYSTHLCVRQKIVQIERELSRHLAMVIDGRDSGSYCLPDAEYKFYLDCDPLERARRRQAELCSRGEDIALDTLYEQILSRDAFDRAKAVAPLVVPDGAIMLDNTHTTIDEVVDTIISHVTSH